MIPCPRAPTGGVREAPRHEIAGSGAATAQRALWGFNPRERHGGGGLSRAGASRTAACGVIGDIWLSGKALKGSLARAERQG
jgi:hypothetical protein